MSETTNIEWTEARGPVRGGGQDFTETIDVSPDEVALLLRVVQDAEWGDSGIRCHCCLQWKTTHGHAPDCEIPVAIAILERMDRCMNT